MKHDMVRPCAKCPFRKDVTPYLTCGRAKEIVDSLRRDASFPCHETTQWVDGDDGEEHLVRRWAEQQCAGVMIIREKQNRPDQMMRIAERLGLYDRTKLDMAAPVYDSFRAFIEAQKDRRGVWPPRLPRDVTAIVTAIPRTSE